jgi:hypothetical protein
MDNNTLTITHNEPYSKTIMVLQYCVLEVKLVHSQQQYRNETKNQENETAQARF